MTIVAAWMSADTGPGPAIASGSHSCSGNCADLPIGPASSSTQTSAIMPGAAPSAGSHAGAVSYSSRKFSVPAWKYRIRMPPIISMSPKPVTTSALRPACEGVTNGSGGGPPIQCARWSR